MVKNYLFVLKKPPYSGLYSQETLDIIFTTSAFEQTVSLLLMDDGVFLLKNNQAPQASELKDTSTLFKALSLYDIDNVYIESESLSERGLEREDLCLPIRLVNRSAIGHFMSPYAVIVSN